MEQQIDLTFDKTIADLAGNTLGRKVYQNQISASFRPEIENVVNIPEDMNFVSSSFIQGLYAEISERYGSARALEMMKVRCKKQTIQDKIDRSIRTYGV